MPPLASYLSGEKMKYKQKLAQRKKWCDMVMNTRAFVIPSVKELLKSPLAIFITFSANDCGYSGHLIVNWINPLFLEAMHGPLADE